MNGKYALGILLTFVLLGGVMLYVFPLIHLILGGTGSMTATFTYSRVVLWIVLLAVFLYSLLVEKQPFLLWKDKSGSLGFYLKKVFSLYLICAIGGAFLNFLIKLSTHENVSSKMLQLSHIFRNNYALIIFTCLTAGVVEEFLMRGYMQPRIEKIYHNRYAGIIVSAVLFGILHSSYGTVGQVLVPCFIGIVFAVFYKIYSNIKILIICHFLYDFVSLMIMNFIDIKHLSVF
ncbi:type II CAAX endopeptidase family protein [uncultured Chryseobacterium sp.]|uniref:CPBP family intramembrane glutamic endopeptidase n=1 Tax=uncultured Chryseobacterium sp. TaxID=259322 RepID=UPI0025F72F5F|nr:type II CAAX endopeptidase family protein [uncultured Chryseobacterium sp.]